MLGFIIKIKRYKKYRSTIDKLSALSDCELEDIGITRNNIPRIAKNLMYGN